MKEFKAIIPDENYSILEFQQEDLPGIAVVNTALRNFESKEVFEWHLSIMLELEDLVDNGMPSKDEVKIIDDFGDFLDDQIKGENKEKPNGLFLARVTWNRTRQLIWRIYDPEIVDNFLKKLIENNDPIRQFDYQMESDHGWKLTKWYLKDHD